MKFSLELLETAQSGLLCNYGLKHHTERHIVALAIRYLLTSMYVKIGLTSIVAKRRLRCLTKRS